MIDQVSEFVSDLSLRHYDRSLLMLTRSNLWEVLATDVSNCLDELVEWAQEHNKKMDAEVLTAVSARPKPVEQCVRR